MERALKDRRFRSKSHASYGFLSGSIGWLVYILLFVLCVWVCLSKFGGVMFMWLAFLGFWWWIWLVLSKNGVIGSVHRSQTQQRGRPDNLVVFDNQKTVAVNGQHGETTLKPTTNQQLLNDSFVMANRFASSRRLPKFSAWKAPKFWMKINKTETNIYIYRPFLSVLLFGGS